MGLVAVPAARHVIMQLHDISSSPAALKFLEGAKTRDSLPAAVHASGEWPVHGRWAMQAVGRGPWADPVEQDHDFNKLKGQAWVLFSPHLLGLFGVREKYRSPYRQITTSTRRKRGTTTTHCLKRNLRDSF